MKIAVLWIGIGPYRSFFRQFYGSFKKNFCPGEDRTFFVFTDDPSLTQGLDDCLTYVVSNACLHPGFILFRRYKYFLMAEDRYLDMDYVTTFNGDAICQRRIDPDEIVSPGITVAWHNKGLKMHGPQFVKSVCKFDAKGEKYHFGTSYCCERTWFMKMMNQIESWRTADKVRGTPGCGVPWHDESYFNAFVSSSGIPVRELPHLLYVYPTYFDQRFNRLADSKIILTGKTREIHEFRNSRGNVHVDLY